MKIECNTTVIEEYPFLGVATAGLMVLFTEEGEGFVLQGNIHYDIGEHSVSWDMDNFTKYRGTVTLSN